MKNRIICVWLGVTLGLSVGLVGCGGGLVEYDLTIASTAGGSVTTPGEGTFTYDEVTVVNLVAEAEEGYRFVEWTGDVATIGNVIAATTIITTNDDYSITANFEFEYTPMVAAGISHTVGLRSDGTVVAVGDNYWGQCDVGGWTGITQVAAGTLHTVGLKADGTVVAVGDNYWGQCDVGGWAGITQVAAGTFYTVGLKADGTVVAMGANDLGQCDVGGWADIQQVAAGHAHTVGLKSDRTVVAVGWSEPGQCDVDSWTELCGLAQARRTRWGLRPTAPWSPWDSTPSVSAMSRAGQTSFRSPQAGITRWGLSLMAEWSPWEKRQWAVRGQRLEGYHPGHCRLVSHRGA